MTVSRGIFILATFVVFTLVSALDTTHALAGEETYYGRNPNADGKVVLVGYTDSTTYTITNLVTGTAISSGTIDRAAQTTVALSSATHFKVVTSEPAMVLMHHDCCSFSGNYFYPTTADGKTFYGTEHFIRPLASSNAEHRHIVHALDAAAVTVTNSAGTQVATQVMTAGSAWTMTGITLGNVFTVTSTGRVAIQTVSGNGHADVPPTPEVNAPQACNNQVGRTFHFSTRGWQRGAIGVFNHSSTTTANVTLTRKSDGTTRMLTVPARASTYVNAAGTASWIATSDQDISIWAGDTEAGDTIRAMGDDVTHNLGVHGTSFVLDSQSQGAYVFVADDNTTITSTSLANPVTLNADELLAIPSNTAFSLTSDKPVTIQTIGGNALNDWATLLHAAPRFDRDNDGTTDLAEGNSCDSLSPDSDGDGILDYRDIDDRDGPIGDADGDGLTNDEETNITGTDPANPDTDGDGIDDGVEVGADVNNPIDTDMDTVIDALDQDDDDDGVLTINEPGDADNSGTPDRLEPCTPDADAVACPTGDPDGDGVPNDVDPDPTDPCIPNINALACDTGDADGDGIDNLTEAGIGTDPLSADSDGDGLCDGTTDVATVCVAGEDAAGGQNSDTDGLIDALDNDDDGDGILTAAEDLNGNNDPTDDDTDNNGTPDYLDNDDDGDGTLSSAEPGDADNSGTPDRLEPCTPDADALACPTGDTDGDGVPNDMDPDPTDPCNPDNTILACPTADTDMDGLTNAEEALLNTDPNNPDSDSDGLRDGDEVADVNNPQDTDMNGTIDALDNDDDGDGILTILEDLNLNNDPTDDDSDNNGTPDYLDNDDDGDGKLTASEDVNMNGDYTDDDSDGDGIPDYLDPDDNDGPNGDVDGDGVPNVDEDIDGDGNYDNDDSDNDGTPDYMDTDDDDDGVLTADEDRDNDGDPQNDDSDNDGTPNYLDVDDDGDGVNTVDEDIDMDGDPTNDDTNMDGTPDFLDPCDPDPLSPVCSTGDTDGDGVPNDMDPDPIDPCVPDNTILACPTADTDMDGLTNAEELIVGTNPNNPDSDGDGIRDGLEVPDVANPRDTDNNSTVDALDNDDDGDGKSTASEDVNMNGDWTDDDTDGDGVPDYLDADDNDGPDGDVDGDGISNGDEDTNGDGNYDNDDTDMDGTPDYQDTDDDGDGVDTIDEDPNMMGGPADDDTDNDGVPNYLDTDDDGDGVNTVDEDIDMDGDPRNDDTNMDGVPNFLDPCDPDDTIAACATGDNDMDGTPNDMDPAPNDPCVPSIDALPCPVGDADMDGVNNGAERNLGLDPSNPDSDGDGVDDGTEVGNAVNPTDTDMDGTIDALDNDDDGDGILTSFEDVDGDGDPTNDDSDNDGTPNYLDPDDDGDGTLTSAEDPDPNGDGDPADAADANMDGTPDYLDPNVPGEAMLSITSPQDGDTVDAMTTVTGTATAGAEVEVFVDGASVGTVTADANGAWALDVALEEGTSTITATSDDGAMAGPVTVTVEGDVVMDEVAISAPIDGETLDNTTFTVEGTATPNATVTVLLDGQEVGTATADDNGEWSFEVSTTNGDHTLEATVGEASSGEITVTIDDGTMSGMIAVSITSPADGDEVSATPTFSGTATAGADIEVLVDGNSVGTTMADDNGDWTFTLDEADALDAGMHTVEVTATLDGDSASAGPVAFEVSDAIAPDDVDVLVVGGACAQAPAKPSSPLLAIVMLGLLGFFRSRRIVAK